MKRYLACTALICVLAPALASAAEPLSATDIVTRMRPSIVTLSILDPDKQKSSGSGVFLTASGQILTCFHLISNAKTVSALLPDGTSARVTGVLSSSRAQDWAVLQSDVRNAVPAPRGKPALLRQGDRVYAVGAPAGGPDPEIAEGAVSRIRDTQGAGLYLWTTAPVATGSSGGPVVNANGEVVGIAAFRMPQGDNLVFAIGIGNVESHWKGTERARPFAAASAEIRGNVPVPSPPDDPTEAPRLFADGLAALPGDGATLSEKETAYRSALTFFEKDDRLWPNDVDIRFQVAYCYGALGETAKAIAGFRTVIRLQPLDPIPHFNLGVVLANAGRTGEAIVEYRTAIRLKPDYAMAHNNLGVMLRRLSRNDEAMQEYRTAIRNQSDLAEAHFNLGLALRKAGRADEAVAEYRTAIRFKPGFDAAHFSLGVAHSEAGRTDEAIAEYKEALSANPDYVQAYFGLGNALYLKSRTDDAVTEYAEAIRICPEYSAPCFRRGVDLDDVGCTDDEIELYRATIEVKYDFAEAQYYLGSALSRLGRTDEAITELTTAIRIKPEYANAHLGLGMAYLAKGDHSSALKEYGILKNLDAEKSKALFDLIYPPGVKAHTG
ncbi:MAG TPA: tetratricopeptide repeat protein [Armatimonadota bacterium]